MSGAVLVILCVGLGLLLSCRTTDVGCGPLPATGLADGVYEGTGTNMPVKVVARVTLKDQRVVGIELLKHRTWRGGAAAKAIPNRIIQKQSTKVDAVTGATISSRAIMRAVQAAVAKASGVTE